MKVIQIVMDSLNRHYLSCYNPATFVRTPNIERLVCKSALFLNHYCGSMPCMPARREMMTGNINYFETPWSPIQPWDRCLPTQLREARDCYSHLITDHYHYFHSGGEGYHTLFDSYEFIRGQENDKWRPLVAAPEKPAFIGKERRAHWVNRSFMDSKNEEEYPSPRTFRQGIDFLRNNGCEDNWFLHLEAFDPHEPFCTPEKYLNLYDDDWDGPLFEWPHYAPVREGEAAVHHIRKKYAAALTMADHWLGKLLDILDQMDLWRDTALLLTSDHGYMLGEYGLWGKNYLFEYHNLTHIPLIVYLPGLQGQPKKISSLTQTVDLMPTILDLFGASAAEPTHGKSLLPLLRQEGEAVDQTHHETVTYGYFGKNINIFDGCYSYCRVPRDNSFAYHHTLMPRNIRDFHDRETLCGAETGHFLKAAQGIPQLRIKTPSYSHYGCTGEDILHDIVNDPEQQIPLRDSKREAMMAEKMRQTMKRCGAPENEFDRVGLP